MYADRKRTSKERWRSPDITVTPSGARTVLIAAAIPERTVQCPTESLTEWKRAKGLWQTRGRCSDCPWQEACERCDYSVWGNYAPLVRDRRYHYADRDDDSTVGFGEGFAALWLETQGFRCRTAVRLFGKRPQVRWGGRNTRWVETQMQRAGIPELRGIGLQTQTLAGAALRAKNPDVVACVGQPSRWRFAEIKRNDHGVHDTVKRGQLVGLTLLHMATGAAVAVVRLVDSGLPAEANGGGERVHRIEFRLPASAASQLNWRQ